MKVDFLEGHSEDFPILRIDLQDTTIETIECFCRGIDDLGSRFSTTFRFQECSGLVEKGCHVVCVVSDREEGLIAVQPEACFEWRRTADGWKSIRRQLDPFLERFPTCSIFDWLDDLSEISVLITTTGFW